MGVLERIKSAVTGAVSVEDDLDMGDSQRVKNMPDPVDPQDAETSSNAQSKADTAESNAESYADTQVSNHNSATAVHGVGEVFDAANYTPETDTHNRYTDGEASAAAPVQDSSDIDHDQTTNRTHDGDDITPAAVEVKETLTDPAGVEHTGQLADGPVLGAFNNLQVFGADGTFDASNVSLAYVEVVGGGGSGGVEQDGEFTTPVGAGGGAGGYAAGYVDVSAVNSVSVTVGSGGDAVGTSVGGSNNGLSSSFGSYLSATGGSGGGTGEFSVGGTGGSGTGGSLNLNGGRGDGQAGESSYGPASGGGSVYSAGEGGVYSSNASNAEGFGGGGAGGGDGRAGAGSGGAVIVRY